MGYYAIAPEMYARQRDVSKMVDIGTILSTVVAKVPDAQVNAAHNRRLYAGIDAFVKPAVINQMRAGLVKSGSGSEIVIFPNVNHGFNADYRPTYDKAAATYAQKLTTNWLKERGV